MSTTDTTSSAPHQPAHTNRLARSNSPYLLQHQHNPVEWYEWGDEAFAEAQRRGVPIFLSVGYSTCYWCHVMERESFESDVIAAVMNRHFVCIKLDREQRPDIDDIYMSAVQLMTRSGGWPMSVWLTPPGTRDESDRGLEAFYAGTYFPATPMHGRPAFTQVLEGIADAWVNNRQQVLDQAQEVTKGVRASLTTDEQPVKLTTQHIGRAISQLLELYDEHNGGFGGAPKFPQPVFIDFLQDVSDGIDDPAIRSTSSAAIRHSLDRMALGGIYDQVGGGFHRYAVDGHWQVPHFEKMLYDNGQLLSVYARSYEQSHDALDERVLRQSVQYLMREMRATGGAFYAAQDAEVNQREGQNYVWTRDQLTEVLDPEYVSFASGVFGLDAGANFQDPHHPDEPATNVLVLAARPSELAARADLNEPDFLSRLDAIRASLYKARQQRDQPSLDDKIIVSWNGLLIGGLADAARVLGDRGYLEVAHQAADWILSNMRTNDGRLLRIHRDGRSDTPAVLEDYAFFCRGLLAIHSANALLNETSPRFFQAAVELIEIAFAEFADEAGVLCDTRAGQHDLLVQTRSTYDGAVPCGLSVMVHNLIDQFHVSNTSEPLSRAAAQLAAISSDIERSPLAAVNSVRALYRLLALVPDVFDNLPETAAATTSHDQDDAVAVYSSTGRIAVTPNTPGRFKIRLDITPGYHIVAAEPAQGMHGFRLLIHNGTGVEVKMSYPAGSAYNAPFNDDAQDPLMVYEGQLEMDVEVHRTDDATTGRPLILCSYQACTDTACSEPRQVELDVAIDLGR